MNQSIGKTNGIGKPRIKKLQRLRAFDYFNYAFMAILCVAFIYPVLLTLSISLSKANTFGQKIVFLPIGLNFESYAYLLKDAKIIRYYINSIAYALGSTVFFLLVTSLMAYPLMQKKLHGKKLIHTLLVITMFFGGGLLPSYYLIKSVGLMNNPLVMIIPGAISAYNVIIFRTFFTNIPNELQESAFMDGAGHFTVLFRIILPVSTPLLATFALFNMVGKWNDYMTALLYLDKESLMPIQMLLRKMLIKTEVSNDLHTMELLREFNKVTSRSAKCAAVIITILPIMCVYPFMQKHFAKGIMVGSLKS